MPSAYGEDGNFRDLTDREAVHKTAKWGVIAFVVIIVLSVGGGVLALGWDSWFSNTKGRLEANQQKNSAINRTQAQAQFHATFESIKNLDRKLTDAQATLNQFNTQHPNVGNGTVFDPLAEQQINLQRDVTGAQQQCRNAVADYDASTETYTLRDFRDSDLPFKITENDPVFNGTNSNGSANWSDYDCQPNR